MTLPVVGGGPAYKIREIDTVKDSGLTYILVDYWDSATAMAKGADAVYREEFMMQLADVGTRIVTNANGWLGTTDGKFIDPATLDNLDPKAKQPDWLYEQFKVDVPSIIAGNIEAHDLLRIANKWTGDHTSDPTKPLYQDGRAVAQNAQKFAPVVRDVTDPQGVLARPDVQALKAVSVVSKL